jgi:uncharacterized protein (TIRG00374 family)
VIAPAPASFFQRLFKPLITIALYALIFYRYVDVRTLLGRLATTDLAYVAAGIAIYICGQLISAFKWQVLLAPVGLAVRYVRIAAFYFIGMFFNNFLPTIVGGDAVKAVLLARETGAPAKATVTVFMERDLGLLALLTIATVAAQRVHNAALFNVSLFAWTIVLVSGFIVANVALTSARAFGVVDRVIAMTPLGNLRPKVASLYGAIEPYKRSIGVLAASIFLSFVFQLIVIVVVFLNVRALGLDHAVPISALAVIVPLGSVAGMLPVSVNGLGVRDYLYIKLLEQFIPAEAALSVALLYFAVTLIASLPGGLVYALSRPTTSRLTPPTADR